MLFNLKDVSVIVVVDINKNVVFIINFMEVINEGCFIVEKVKEVVINVEGMVNIMLFFVE